MIPLYHISLPVVACLLKQIACLKPGIVNWGNESECSMISTLVRILTAARKYNPNLVKLCWRWKAEDPGDGQKNIDPVSCIRIQGKSILFALVATFVSIVIAVVLWRLGFSVPATVILLLCICLCFVVDKDRLKNNRWVFDNARQFFFAVWLAEKLYGKPFTEWEYERDEGFSCTKAAVLLKLELSASEVAKMQDIPFEARKAAKMKLVWLWEKTLLRQLFPELPEHDGRYFPLKTESGK